jgi:hypothetical protein
VGSWFEFHLALPPCCSTGPQFEITNLDAIQVLDPSKPSKRPGK